MKDPYEVLGIQRGASDDEIKKAYRAKCKRWHPDLNPNDPTAEEHFKEVQAAYDAITKGETGPQMGGGYGGAYGQQSGPSYGGYQQGYQQNGYSNGDFGDFGFGYDPFGFGFGFGGNYQQQRGPGYNGADTPEMQAARNFIINQRYPEARRVLDGMTGRNARWYYLSSLANQGLGNRIDALQDARRAVQLDPGNTEYQMHLRRMQNPDHLHPARRPDAVVLEHDPAEPAVQLLLRRLWRLPVRRTVLIKTRNMQKQPVQNQCTGCLFLRLFNTPQCCG